MLNIEGNTLVTTDWHWGLKNSSLSRINILLKVTNEICKYIKNNGINNVIFCGDFMHNRNQCSIQTLNIAYKCLEKIAQNCKFYFIVGNHDIYMKTSLEISSAKLFKDIKNVTIIDKVTECTVNGKTTILCPWLSDLSSFKKETFHYAFGHFDVSAKYLIASYIESNIQKNLTTPELTKMINEDELLSESGLDDIDFEIENFKESFINHQKSSELIGNWIDVVKRKGIIFSGHIHHHKEFYAKERKFIFVGSPYQQTLGEIDSEDGFYVIDDDNNVKFEKLDSIPKHIELKMSKIVNEIDSFDFSVVKGNIVHKVYDDEIDRVLDAKISQRISDNKPYEELNPDYDLKSSYSNDDENLVSESIGSIRKSKKEYLHNYINNIDSKVLEEEKIEKDKLFEVINEYYDIVNEGVK